MSEVFKALQNLKVSWKNIGLYNMKCRWVRNLANYKNQRNNILKDNSKMIEDEDEGAMILPTVIKFELQVYENFFFVKIMNTTLHI